MTKWAKKQLDSGKHYGGVSFCSLPLQQGRQSCITSLYIRRRTGAVSLFSPTPDFFQFSPLHVFSDPSLFIRSRWGMLPTGGWASGHMETREEEKRRQERNTQRNLEEDVYFPLKPVANVAFGVSQVTILTKMYTAILKFTAECAQSKMSWGNIFFIIHFSGWKSLELRRKKMVSKRSRQCQWSQEPQGSKSNAQTVSGWFSMLTCIQHS